MSDINILAAKILAEKRGDIPPGSVTVEELRAALAERRQKYAEGETPRATTTTKRTAPIVVPDDAVKVGDL